MARPAGGVGRIGYAGCRKQVPRVKGHKPSARHIRHCKKATGVVKGTGYRGSQLSTEVRAISRPAAAVCADFTR